MRLISSRQRRRRFMAHISNVDFTVTVYVFMPVTKVPCGPRDTAISRDRWLVVVTVVVWCPLRILYVLRRTWNRRVSFLLDRGDAGTQQASSILSNCIGLCFGACYQSSLWAEKTVILHYQWLVVVTVVVWCPLQVYVISNGHLSVIFLGLFVTLDQ
jgi:hypothetical protein